MPDIFSQDAPNIQAYKLGKTLIQFGKEHNKLVCQSANFTYTQNIVPVTPLNKDKKYLIVGDASGTGSLNLLIGPSEDVKGFIDQYSNACNSNDKNVIELMSPNGCKNESKDLTFTLRGVIITQVGTTLQRGSGAGDIMIAQIGFMFNSLEFA